MSLRQPLIIELVSLRFLLKIREDICNLTLIRSVSDTADEFCFLIGIKAISGVNNAGENLITAIFDSGDSLPTH
jgi:hypothetical protein